MYLDTPIRQSLVSPCPDVDDTIHPLVRIAQTPNEDDEPLLLQCWVWLYL